MDLQTPLSKTNSRIYKTYASRLEKLGIITLEDFLLHLPSRYEDYSIISKIGYIQPGETVTLQGQVLEIKNQYLQGGRIKTMQKAVIADETGSIQLLWFNQPFLTRAIQVNSTLSISGKIEWFSRKLAIKNPEYEVLYNEQTGSIHTGRLIPIYPETKGISSKWLRRQTHKLIEEYGNDLKEYLPDEIIKKNHFMNYPEAIKEVHFPHSLEQVEQARERLAFDELFFIQLGVTKRKKMWQEEQQSIALKIENKQNEINKLIASLPFTLTNAQQKAVNDILLDLSKTKTMNRLLQGDVGSGKTIVSAIAAYAVYLNGLQTVLMAPTEILAKQHYASIHKLLTPFGVKVDLVTGSTKLGSMNQESGSTKISKNSKFEIRNSNLKFDILIGTHAVLNDKIQFDNLALVIIDEQQRFGVEQRGKIRKKGVNPHLLTMTATPIPRTVALTMYGDLDLSYLDEMPYGRKKVKTWFVPPEKRDGAYNWIRKQVKETDSQVFIICPFIEDSESMQTVKAAKSEFERLKSEIFPDLKLGMLHGKLKSKEKDEILQSFRDREYDILVATPVVEVGIDIPNATVIMIEAADRFGLAQLHQLRGRVGRGDKQSYCLLFAETKNDITTQRLKAMETLYSGASLAELDLKLRGPGNLYGTAQHGIPKLKVASFFDTRLIQMAKHNADELFPQLGKYPELESRMNLTLIQTVSPD